MRRKQPTHGFICFIPVYEYAGFTFEWHDYFGGPWPLKKDGSPRARAGKIFYDAIDSWLRLPDEERAKTRISGGCERF